MQFNEITFGRIKDQVENYLKDQYNKADKLFSNASPFGQILSVVENLFQSSILYLKNTLKQFDLSNSNGNNATIVKGAAIISGHIVGRANSATGTLKLTTKTSVDLAKELPGNRITILNKGLMRNKANGLEYSTNIGLDKQTHNITQSSVIYLPIIQGKWESMTFTGNGGINQTFQVELRNSRAIENNNVEVYVNGELWEIKKGIYDLLTDEKSCVVTTSYNGGIDIKFGNGGFGAIPEVATIIEVRYLISDGANGSIFRRTLNDFTFIDCIIDGNGSYVGVSELFDVEYYTDINFGSNSESVSFTRNILPLVSNNFVIGTPSQYAYQIKKLGIFTHVNAYRDGNGVKIIATPDINLFKASNATYFDVEKEAFELDSYEKNKLIKYLKSNGNILLGDKVEVVNPILSNYVINVYVSTYTNTITETVNNEIYNAISNYFLNLNSLGRIPKSDIINIISELESVYSVDIDFICKKNEDYHRVNKEAFDKKISGMLDSDNLSIYNDVKEYDDNTILGIDPILGDIIFEPKELPVIRGGFKDRDNNFFSSGVDTSSLKAVNIFHKEKINR